MKHVFYAFNFVPMNVCRATFLVTAVLLAFSAYGASAEESDLFRQECAALAQDAEKSNSMAVAGKDGWLFLAGELRHIGAGKFWGEAALAVSKGAKASSAETATKAKPEATDPLPAILDFNDQLKKIGVKLIVAPVPPKAVIYPEMLPGFTNRNNAARLDRFHQEFYALLRSNDVRVLDLTELFLQNKRGPFQAPSQGLYCCQDSHWSGNACVLAAEKIAEAIHPFLVKNPSQTNGFRSEWQTVEISGDLWRSLNNKDIPQEKLRVRKIIKPGAAGDPVETDVKSQIVLLGDSHNLIFHSGDDMQARGAGLPDQLAFELDMPVDLVAVRGSGATPARINLMRRARQNENYWANKKCVIWCFSAREFTESDGWRQVPIK